jgi:uncharacterized membrane protein YfhO
MHFSEGRYVISDLKAYSIPVAFIEGAAKSIDPLIIDMKNTFDNKITGDIQVTNDGYFATTLPYDKGYIITVDGIKQSYKKVNTSFIGFPIEKGLHNIIITYHAPYKRIGIVLSIIGMLMFVYIIIIDKKNSYNFTIK